MNLGNKFWKFSDLTGPIFNKELVVSSRRRRNYVLRSIYIALLALFVVMVWVDEVRYSGSTVYRVSRMSQAGKSIVAIVVWFQFIMCQFVAVVMLSTSISDEIYHKTLGVLMTTPVNSFQIVMGKLLSKLLQLIILLVISLPLLAIVRIFGGIPWDFVLSSLCITLATAVFFGSVSLFFSIFYRRAYVTILVSFLVLGTIFGLFPLLTAMVYETMNLSERAYVLFFSYIHPYFQMILKTEYLMSPRGAGLFNVHWFYTCIILMGLSLVILTFSMIFVRRVALRQAAGQSGIFERRRKIFRKKAGRRVKAGNIRTVKGLPVLWKELKMPLFGRHKKTVIAVMILALIILFWTYAFFANEDAWDEEEFHILYSIIFMGLGMLFTIVIPSTLITSEKESRSWQLLLTTIQSDWQILFGKLAGGVRRCLPAWFFLFGHIIFFSFCGMIHPLAVILMVIIVFWIILFHTSTGIYFSSRFKHTTTAVIMNFVLPGFLWLFIPFIIVIISEAFHFRPFYSRDLLEYYIDGIPFIQDVVVIEGTANRGYIFSNNFHNTFDWPEGPSDVSGTLSLILFIAFLYICISFVFLWRAKCNFRKKIF